MNDISSAIAHADCISSDKDVWLRCRLRLELPLVPETLVLSCPLAGLQLQGLSQDVCGHCALPLRQEACPSLPAALEEQVRAGACAPVGTTRMICTNPACGVRLTSRLTARRPLSSAFVAGRGSYLKM